MNKKECNIVRDLLPNLVENLITDDSKQFVQNHISNCSECEEILEMLQNDKNKQIINSNEKDKIEINHLKKYSRKMSLLKMLLFSIIVIIIVILIVLSIYLVKSIHIRNIKITAYNNVQKLEKLDNFAIYEVYRQLYLLDNTEFYSFSTSEYKDNKLKVARKSIDKNNNLSYDNVYYTEMGSNKRIEIDNISKTVTNATYNYTFDNPSQISLTANALIDATYHANFFIGICFEWFTDIKTKTYNNVECYVLRTYNSNNSNEYNEVWIDKERMFPIRTIMKFEKQYTEIIYSISINNLTDEDFKIQNIDFYTIKDIQYNIKDDILKGIETIY